MSRFLRRYPRDPNRDHAVVVIIFGGALAFLVLAYAAAKTGYGTAFTATVFLAFFAAMFAIPPVSRCVLCVHPGNPVHSCSRIRREQARSCRP